MNTRHDNLPLTTMQIGDSSPRVSPAKGTARDRIFIVDSHPVQYKAPLYQELERLAPGRFEVIYATDASIRGNNVDQDFGTAFAWDIPLLQGYSYRVLNNEFGTPLTTPASLTGRGVFSLLRRERPAGVILTGFFFRYDQVAYASALLLGIPIMIRHETQDEMFSARRSKAKSWLRSGVYRALYAPLCHAFAIGQLNRMHLLRHGVSDRRITVANYSVPNPIETLGDHERLMQRQSVRQRFGIGDDRVVVGFCGKLIPKKNPDLLVQALEHLENDVRAQLHLLFVGSGELGDSLASAAADAEARYGVRTSFAGFVNQSALSPFYLAMDIFVLPSRRMGEAWGLVVNEALQAGCAVVVSDAVGCRDEFSSLPRFRVTPIENAKALAGAITELARNTRDFHWAEAHMEQYSTRATAGRIHEAVGRLLT